jgi:hypothetical protein
MADVSSRRWQPYVMFGLIVFSAAINVLLILKVRSEQRVISSLKTQNRLHDGQNVPNIIGKNPQGEIAEVNFSTSSKPTILYVFSPACGWCKRNFENMTVLRRSVRDKYEFIGISLTDKGLSDYIKMNKVDYPVITELPETTKTIYRLGGTPATIVVSPTNKVLKAWTGAYNGPLEAEISNYFNVKLPGLLARN